MRARIPSLWQIHVSQSADTTKETPGEHLNMYVIHLIHSEETSPARSIYDALRGTADDVEGHGHDVLGLLCPTNSQIPLWIAIPGSEHSIGILLEYVGESGESVLPSGAPAVDQFTRRRDPGH